MVVVGESCHGHPEATFSHENRFLDCLDYQHTAVSSCKHCERIEVAPGLWWNIQVCFGNRNSRPGKVGNALGPWDCSSNVFPLAFMGTECWREVCRLENGSGILGQCSCKPPQAHSKQSIAVLDRTSASCRTCTRPSSTNSANFTPNRCPRGPHPTPNDKLWFGEAFAAESLKCVLTNLQLCPLQGHLAREDSLPRNPDMIGEVAHEWNCLWQECELVSLPAIAHRCCDEIP